MKKITYCSTLIICLSILSTVDYVKAEEPIDELNIRTTCNLSEMKLAKMRADINKFKIDKLNGYVNQYKLMYGFLPTKLRDLIECPSDAKTCIPITDVASINDASDKEFIYSVDGDSFTIISSDVPKEVDTSCVDRN